MEVAIVEKPPPGCFITFFTCTCDQAEKTHSPRYKQREEDREIRSRGKHYDSGFSSTPLNCFLIQIVLFQNKKRIGVSIQMSINTGQFFRELLHTIFSDWSHLRNMWTIKEFIEISVHTHHIFQSFSSTDPSWNADRIRLFSTSLL